MKVSKSSNGIVTVQAEGTTVKGLFKELAVLEEVFTERECGCCGGTALRFVVRHVEDNDFYELHCKDQKCRARLAFGAHKQGETLFPKRAVKDKKTKVRTYLPDNGWAKWSGKEEEATTEEATTEE